MVDLRNRFGFARLALPSCVHHPDLAIQWHSPSGGHRRQLLSGTTWWMGHLIGTGRFGRRSPLLVANNAGFAEELQARGSRCTQVHRRALR